MLRKKGQAVEDKVRRPIESGDKLEEPNYSRESAQVRRQIPGLNPGQAVETTKLEYDGIFRHPCAKKNEVMMINSNESNADRKALLENALFGDREMFNEETCDDSLGVMMSDSGNKKRERITLADLFSAETNTGGAAQQDHVILVKSSAAGHGGVGEHATAKPPPLPASSLPTKTGLSFAKKIIPKLVGDRRPRRPINKLHQLMTRMLRRKIHPEMEGKKSQTKPTPLTTK
nr:pescadillo homolog [Ipomoea batatas]